MLPTRSLPDPLTLSLDVAFSPDGGRLATASDCGTVRVGEVATGRGGDRLLSHTGTVFSVALSPDDRRLAASGFDRTAKAGGVSPRTVDYV